jgi:hypothetical protein
MTAHSSPAGNADDKRNKPRKSEAGMTAFCGAGLVLESVPDGLDLFGSVEFS